MHHRYFLFAHPIIRFNTIHILCALVCFFIGTDTKVLSLVKKSNIMPFGQNDIDNLLRIEIDESSMSSAANS